MNALLDSICKAGLNRARIHDALADIEQYDGVTGHMIFDPNQKNVAPMYLGTVHNGAITYRVATMEKTPAVAQTACARSTPMRRRCPMRASAKMAWTMPVRIATTSIRARCACGSVRTESGPDCGVKRDAGGTGGWPKRKGGSGSCCLWIAIRTGAPLPPHWFTH